MIGEPVLDCLAQSQSPSGKGKPETVRLGEDAEIHGVLHLTSTTPAASGREQWEPDAEGMTESEAWSRLGERELAQAFRPSTPHLDEERGGLEGWVNY